MRTIDFREVLARELQDPELRREFIVACFEQDGVDGLHMALDEIARADAVASSTQSIAVNDTDSLRSLRTLLNQMGLDVDIVRLPTPNRELATV